MLYSLYKSKEWGKVIKCRFVVVDFSSVSKGLDFLVSSLLAAFIAYCIIQVCSKIPLKRRLLVVSRVTGFRF